MADEGMREDEDMVVLLNQYRIECPFELTYYRSAGVDYDTSLSNEKNGELIADVAWRLFYVYTNHGVIFTDSSHYRFDGNLLLLKARMNNSGHRMFNIWFPFARLKTEDIVEFCMGISPDVNNEWTAIQMHEFIRMYENDKVKSDDMVLEPEAESWKDAFGWLEEVLTPNRMRYLRDEYLKEQEK